MSDPKITKMEVIEFEYFVENMEGSGRIQLPGYAPGTNIRNTARMVVIHTDEGVTGEYVGGSATEHSAIGLFAKAVIGESAFARERIYNDAKQATRQHARMGMSQVDMALWDLAGKLLDQPIYRLLGEQRKSFPAYASTYIGDNYPGGLNSPEAYADFAEQCYDMGYKAFKIHPWQEAPIEKHVRLVEVVGERVGDKMDLMLDPFCAILTFGDALKIGRACEAYNYYWWEDVFKDGGESAFAHRKLRELIRVPLLQLEHVRGLEKHVDFIVADGTDFVRIDHDYDGGITGVMKIAHASEGFGLDVEPHGPGPSRRQTMAAMRNSNYYELGLVHPKLQPSYPPVYLDGYSDMLDAIDENGHIHVTDLPGMGVTHDWDFINKHTVDKTTYD